MGLLEIATVTNSIFTIKKSAISVCAIYIYTASTLTIGAFKLWFLLAKKQKFVYVLFFIVHLCLNKLQLLYLNFYNC